MKSQSLQLMRSSLLVLMLTLTSYVAQAKNAEFSNLPFWMPDYDVYLNWRPEQKKYFVSEFTPLAQKLNSLRALTESKVQEAAESEETWIYLMRKVYRDCQKIEAPHQVCDALAKVRVKTFEAYGMANSEKSLKAQEAEVKALQAKEKSQKKSAPNSTDSL